MKDSDTPRTLACLRDGKWHADELANLCAKLERESANLKEHIDMLNGDIRKNALEGQATLDKANNTIVLFKAACDAWRLCAEEFYQIGTPDHNLECCRALRGDRLCSHHRARIAFEQMKGMKP